MKPLAELISFLKVWRNQLRTRREYANLVDCEALQTIAKDIKAGQDHAAQLAHTARVCDDEGIALIEKVAADGKVTADEMGDIQTALRNLRRSRDLDQQLSENPA